MYLFEILVIFWQRMYSCK